MKIIIALCMLVSPLVVHAQIANSCIDDTTKCETNYDTSVGNDQGSHDIFCTLTNVLVSCVTAQAARADCKNNAAEVARLRKKAQEQLNIHKCSGIVEANKCQADLDKCQRTFDSTIAQVGDQVGPQCKAGAAFTTCLDNLDSDPNCAGKTAAIDTLRKKIEESINKAQCDKNPDNPKQECNSDVKTCETRFITDLTFSGTDVKQGCLAGATLDACLKGREGLPDCKGSQSYIDTLRAKYKDQIDQDGCASAYTMHCAQGIENCKTDYSKEMALAAQTTDKCSIGNTCIDCLNAVSCPTAYDGQRQQVMTQVTTDLAQPKSCQFKTLHVGGSAVNVKPAVSVILLVALIALVA